MSEKEDGHQANVKTHSGEKPIRQMYSDGEKKNKEKTQGDTLKSSVSKNF